MAARDRSKREGARSHRLFIGIEIPDDARSLLWDEFAPVREVFPQAKWVPPQNYHVTLRFLGPVWPRLIDWVEGACARAAAEVAPFEMGLLGAGSFPAGKRAAVLWTGVVDPADGCALLVQRLTAELEPEFPGESRPFSPHLTVARSRPPLDLGEALAGVSLASDRWTVGGIVLFESHLGRPAPRYEALQRLPLAGA